MLNNMNPQEMAALQVRWAAVLSVVVGCRLLVGVVSRASSVGSVFIRA